MAISREIYVRVSSAVHQFLQKRWWCVLAQTDFHSEPRIWLILAIRISLTTV